MTNTPTLNSSFIKIRRARVHIAELERLLDAYLQATPPTWTTKFMDVGGRKGVYFEVRWEPFPEEFGAVFGDAIHNLRASLDLAAVECVRTNKQNDKKVYFPFCEDASELDKLIAKRNIDRAHPEIADYIKSLAPFKGGNIKLRAIHDLDIIDKHREILPQTISITSPPLELHDGNGNYYEVPKIVGSTAEPSDIKFIFPVDTPFATQEIIPVLHNLVRLTDGIVTELARILDSLN